MPRSSKRLNCPNHSRRSKRMCPGHKPGPNKKSKRVNHGCGVGRRSRSRSYKKRNHAGPMRGGYACGANHRRDQRGGYACGANHRKDQRGGYACGANHRKDQRGGNDCHLGSKKPSQGGNGYGNGLSGSPKKRNMGPGPRVSQRK